MSSPLIVNDEWSVKVREATAVDMDDVHELLLGFLDSQNIQREDSVQRDVFKKQSGFFHPNTKAYFHVFVAEATCPLQVSKQLVGYSLDFFMYNSSWKGLMLYLQDLFVKDLFRGKHVGHLLMEANAKRAKEHECTCIKLWCRESNPAIKFYKGHHGKLTNKAGPRLEFEFDSQAMETIIQSRN